MYAVEKHWGPNIYTMKNHSYYPNNSLELTASKSLILLIKTLLLRFEDFFQQAVCIPNRKALQLYMPTCSFIYMWQTLYRGRDFLRRTERKVVLATPVSA